MSEKNCKATFRIKKEKWIRFKKICENKGLDASTVLRLYIANVNEKKEINLDI